MAYDFNAWNKRLALRTDITSYLVHFTRPRTINGKDYSAVDILLEILKQQKLIGSTTQSGYIVGGTPAVCFQETPLVWIAQSWYHEKQEREKLNTEKIRYSGVGLRFHKYYVYRKDGRPVIYETTEKSKSILPPSEWWRIVDLNYENENDITDWTHEREWRVPGDFHFELKYASVIVANARDYHELISKCHIRNLYILKQIRGIVTLENIFM